MTTLENAHREWANRSADERFPSLDALHATALASRQRGAQSKVRDGDIHVKAIDGDLVLNGNTGTNAKFTNWSFGQFCTEIEAPASYLSTLPAPLAAECINHGMEDIEPEGRSLCLFDRGENGLTLRALNSLRYSRIWDADITDRLMVLKHEQGWNEAPAAFDGSRGMYRGDRDMFCFMVDNDRRIFETDKGGLSRGFFAWNSEVGARSFGVMTFLYEYVCGNHRVWGASDVTEWSIRHVGNANERGFDQFAITMKEYANASAKDDEAKVLAARNFQIGATKDEVIDAVFGLRVAGLGRKMIADAYDLAEKRVDWYGSPRSAWGLAGGITEIARDLVYADARVSLDRAGAKVMEMAF